MRSEGYSTWSVRLSTLILALQAMRRPMSDTSGFRATKAWKLKRWFSSNECVPEIWRENKPTCTYASACWQARTRHVSVLPEYVHDEAKRVYPCCLCPASVTQYVVYVYSGARGYEAAYEWYQRLQGYESMKKKAETTALTGDIIMTWKQARKLVCMDYVGQV